MKYFILTMIVLVIIIIGIASHPKSLQYVAQKYIKDNGIEYKKIEGSLLTGVTLYDVNYANAVKINTLEIKYNLLQLLSTAPIVQSIKTEGLLVLPKNFPRNEQSDETFSLPSFSIYAIQMDKTQILVDTEAINFDLTAIKLRYYQQLSVKSIALSLDTSYGKLHMQGSVKSNRLNAETLVMPESSVTQRYLHFLENVPKQLMLDINADLKKISVHAHLDEVKLREDQNRSLSNIDINASYFIADHNVSLDANYELTYDKFKASIKQKALLTNFENYTTQLQATVTQQAMNLPFKRVTAIISGDTQEMKGQFTAGALELDVLGEGYENFSIQLKSKELTLDFIPELPQLLREDSMDINADAKIHVSPFSMKGNFDVKDAYGITKGDFSLAKQSISVQGRMLLKPETTLVNKKISAMFSQVDFVYDDHNETTSLNINANKLSAGLFKKGLELAAWGKIGSSDISASSTFSEEADINVDVSATVPSVNVLLTDLGLTNAQAGFFFDAKLKLNGRLLISDKVSLKSDIKIPWYIVKPDSKRSYKGENLYFKSTVIDNTMTIDQYGVKILDHFIYSKRPSVLSFDSNGTIDFNELWIFDDLLLTGKLNPLQMQGALQIKSDGFRYDAKEGNVTAKADIQALFDSNGTQSIQGEITLLDGIINYEPTKDYSISDDIIIIQDIKENKESKQSINLSINAVKPIRYKTKEIDIKVIPDLYIWQEQGSPTTIFGVLTIKDGEVRNQGKSFLFDKSEIYFNGSNPMNPYLNLNLHFYTLDNIDIEIFITNTLSSPVVVFSSKPAMSQNDIISYILFGKAASSAFESSGEGDTYSATGSLLLATGLKQIFNDTANVNIDTLNILTNKEGTLGYEIGTRFGKQVRLVYKNDTISSVILQYSVSRSIRIDIDVDEVGQGVSILFVKDFK